MIGKLFVYDTIALSDDRTVVDFNYRIDTDSQSFNLTETLELPEPLPDNTVVDKLLQALHLALGVSYYKTFLPPAIEHPYELDSSQASFWNEVFMHGLGEFLYKNQIDPSTLASFNVQDGKNAKDNVNTVEWQEKALLGIGGGKDSIVAGEMLKELGVDTTGFVVATGDNKGQTQEVADVMQVDLLPIKRNLDSQIFSLNKIEGALNGHVPISLIFALSGCLLATINRAKYVIVANESSASIPDVVWRGQNINHQWSKSLDFERLFQKYVHDHISEKLHYFSFIRPLSSVAVAKLFAHYPQYSEVFTSDNAALSIKKGLAKGSRWGEKSTKSLSSYILLAPWMKEEDLDRAFGSNFLDKIELTDLFLALLNVQGEKVLDCVGTPEELLLSISMLKQQNRMLQTALMELAEEHKLFVPNTSEILLSALSLDQEHSLPNQLKQKILNLMKEKLS